MLTTNFHLTKSLTIAVLVLVSVTMALVLLTTPQQARAATADSMTFTSTGRTSATLDYAAATTATYHARHREAGNNSWTSMGSATASAPGIVLNFTATGLEPNVSYDFEVSTDSSFPTANTDSATFSNRPDHLDLELASGNQNPRGMWSDGTTLWIANDGEGDNNRIYAYALPAGTHLQDKTFTLSDPSHTAPGGVHGRGTTLWVTDTKTDQIIAYSIADDDTYGNHLQGQSFDTNPSEKMSGLTMPHGITSDEEGITLWTASFTEESLLAYDFGDSITLGTRDSSKDCDLFTNYSSPAGAWHGNDDTIYVADRLEKRIFAYDQDAQGCQDRRPLREIRLVGANAAPWGIWSDDGTADTDDTMYVVDDEDDRIYAYYVPLRTYGDITRSSISHPDAGSVDIAFTFSNPAGDSKTLTLEYFKDENDATVAVTETTTGETATFSLTDLDEGAVYTGHASLNSHRAPLGFRVLAEVDRVKRTLHSVVREREDDFPWIKAAYNGIRRDNTRIASVANPTGSFASISTETLTITNIGMYEKASHATYVHELAHAWTMSHGSSDIRPHFIGMGWLYFADLSAAYGGCDPELYADAVTHVTEGFPDVVYSYFDACVPIVTKPSDATNNLVMAVMNGEYPAWFRDRYRAENLPYHTSELEGVTEDYDLEQAIADLDSTNVVVYDKLRTGFGGFCPGYDSETTRNPFRVGGCVPRAPVTTARRAGEGAVILSWTTPSYDGGSPITGYEYRQRSESQHSKNGSFGPWAAIEDSGAGQANSNRYRVTGLDGGTQYHFQLRAVNDVDPGAASNIAMTKGPPTVSITAAVAEPATAPFRVTFTFTDRDSEGNEYDVTGFDLDDIAAFYTRRGHPSYEFQLDDFRVETPKRVYSALVDEIIEGKLWVEVPANSARSTHDDQGNTSAFRTWQVDAPDPPPATPSAEETNVWNDTLTVGGRGTGIMGYFVGWSSHTDKDERFGALPNAAFTHHGTEYEILELSYVGSWRVARLSMCPMLPSVEDAQLRLGDKRVEFDADNASLRKFRRAKDGARQQCGEYDWEKTTLDWSYGDQVPVSIILSP